ncbi:tRNA-modifying protein YgfZ [Litchfieldella qijiaojingensis]|uniref:tRNA-modifying protein YgfZ n=1 Tax=Litchfieldella qijiaojingensis TaxID=980347 RepID=A0ABQ2YCS6_9GAMM|nr:folate-binding protein YgfZ [Halomonas qijiaojingensis]GGX79429.1 tRNA-modifying protein YgfZ [Halomonas qijiaojingensis]
MTDWNALVGATPLDERRVGFDTPDQARKALDTSVRTPLAHLGILEISGADAERFLQGQASAQLSLASSGFAPLTCFCTPKGRMLANAQVVRVEDQRFWLIPEYSLLSPLKEHLDKFAAFYKADMRVRDDLVMLGLIGNEAPALLEAKLDIEPPAVWHHARQGERHALRHPGPRPRLLLIVPEQDVGNVWELLAPHTTPVGNAVWCLHDIQAGMAWMRDVHRDTYLPQMINWEALGGISFKKGCYTGQEVVARAHFRGQVKKRLIRAQLEGAELPEPGDAVEDSEGKPHGEVFCAELDAYGQAEILAVMTTKEVPGPLSVAGQRLKPLKLPYAVERLDPESLVQKT